MTDRIGAARPQDHTQPTSTDYIKQAEAQTTDGRKIGPVDWSAGHETMMEVLERSRTEPTPKAVYEFVKQHKDSIRKLTKNIGVVPTAVLAGTVGTIVVAGRKIMLGDALKQAAQRDAIDQVILSDSSFDREYVAAQHARMGGSGNVKHLTTQRVLVAHKAEIQQQIDAGRAEALHAVRYPGGPEIFLKAHPDLAKQLQADVALFHGWQEVLFFAQQHRGDKLEEIGRGIDARTEADMPAQCPRDFGAPVKG